MNTQAISDFGRAALGATIPAVGLQMPTPYRQTWAAYQQVGLRLWEDG